MRLLQRQVTGLPIEGLCPVVRCLFLLDSSSIDGRRTFESVKRGFGAFFGKLKVDRDMPTIIETSCAYAGDWSSWDGVFGKIGNFKFAVPSDRSIALTDGDLMRARDVLVEAERLDSSGRRTLASVLVILTGRERVALDDTCGVEFVWPYASGPNWAADLPRQFSILADGFIYLVDKELSW